MRFRHYWKNSHLRPTCDVDCRKRILCDARSGRSHDRKSLCGAIEARIESTERQSWGAWLYNGLAVSYVILNFMIGFSWNTLRHFFLAAGTDNNLHETE